MKKYPKQITDILSDYISTLSPTIKILNITDKADGTFDLIVDDIAYMQNNMAWKIFIDKKEYIINTVNDITNTINVSGTIITKNYFVLYPVYFFYGTIKETESQLKVIYAQKEKTPMIYMLTTPDTTSETWNTGGEAYERKCSLKLFFLTQTDYSCARYDVERDSIAPMQRLVFNFMDNFVKIPQVMDTQELNNYTTEEYSKFGYYSEKGGEANYFTDQLAGVGLELNFLLSKSEYCK